MLQLFEQYKYLVFCRLYRIICTYIVEKGCHPGTDSERRRLTDSKESVPGGGVTSPEGRVQFVMKLFADDEVQRRGEHVL